MIFLHRKNGVGADKGWICLAYTSLLRITTTPPEKDEARESASIHEHVPAAPEPAVVPPERNSQGRFASLRPAFLRGISRQGNQQADLERGLPQPATAAA